MANRSALPKPILILTMKKLVNVSDNIRFSSKERFYLPRRTPPGLIIPGDPNNSCKTKCFFPFSNQNDTIVYHNLPLVSLPEKSENRGSYKRWLVIVSPKLEMVMLNLVSGVRYRLPDVTTLPPVPQILALSNTHIYCSISSVKKKSYPRALPVITLQNALSLLCTLSHHSLAYCKLEDTICSSIKSTDSIGNPCNGFNGAIYHKSHLYGLHETGKIFFCDLTAPSSIMKEFVASPHGPLNKQYSTQDRYLAESGGELLSVYHRKDQTHTRIGYRKTMFEICNLEFNLKKWIAIATSGEYALFLGLSRSFSLSELNVRGIKRNHIHFMDDCIHADFYYKDTGYDISEFNLQSSTIGFHPTSFRLTYPPGIWASGTRIKS